MKKIQGPQNNGILQKKDGFGYTLKVAVSEGQTNSAVTDTVGNG